MSESAQTPQATGSDGRTYFLVLIVLAASGFAGVWSLSQAWVTAVTTTGFGEEAVSVSGSTLYPLSLAGAWLGLAGVLAVIATSGKVRRGIGLLIAVAAIALCVGPIAFLFTSEAVAISESAKVAATGATRTSYWLITVACALAMFAAALVVWARGSRWRALSGRQDGSAKPTASSWELLDQGVDPTAQQ